MAAAIHRNLPATLLTLFNDDYDGQGLLGLPTSKGIKTPTASEVSLNYVFLLPLVQAFPSKDGVDKLFAQGVIGIGIRMVLFNGVGPIQCFGIM